jgi:Icc-related predicted phosphoesterase
VNRSNNAVTPKPRRRLDIQMELFSTALRPKQLVRALCTCECAWTEIESNCTTAIYGRIPFDTEILITHTPPRMILDQTKRGKHAGCRFLAARLKELTACRLHVFGHIHDAHGAQFINDENRTVEQVAVNAALFSGGKAITVDLRN